MEVWTGTLDVSAITPKRFLQDLFMLNLENATQTAQISYSAKLSLLSLVDPDKIPLGLIVGEELRVATRSEDSKSWFEDVLIHNALETKDETYAELCWHSQLGILLGVDDDQSKHSPAQPRITELLLYARSSVHQRNRDDRGAISVITPLQPSLTSPSSLGPFAHGKPVHLVAIPLSSELSYRYAGPKSFPPSPPHESTEVFLQVAEEQALPSHDRKRQRMSSLFDGVEQRNKQKHRQDGKSIAKTMASLSNRQHNQTPNSIAKRSTAEPAKTCHSSNATTCSSVVENANSALAPRDLQISHSQGAFASSHTGNDPPFSGNQREVTRAEPSQRTSANFAYQPSQEISSEELLERNRNALSRLVLAGMRMRGIQAPLQTHNSASNNSQLQNPSNFVQEAGVPLPQATDRDYEEYKQLYHHTFRAASFAKRRCMYCRVISPEEWRVAVEELLSLFCGSVGLQQT